MKYRYIPKIERQYAGGSFRPVSSPTVNPSGYGSAKSAGTAAVWALI